MASVLTHALVGSALGQAAERGWRRDWRFWGLVVTCSILPDIDSIGFHSGIPYSALWGHRGMTHSLLFAAIVAAIMSVRFTSGARNRIKLSLLLFVITASHGLLDAMTDGGLGVAFFSPFNPQRYFLPWTPIHVSPIGASGFFSARGLDVIKSEIAWIWGPTLIVGVLIYGIQAWRLRRG